MSFHALKCIKKETEAKFFLFLLFTSITILFDLMVVQYTIGYQSQNNSRTCVKKFSIIDRGPFDFTVRLCFKPNYFDLILPIS